MTKSQIEASLRLFKSFVDDGLFRVYEQDYLITRGIMFDKDINTVDVVGIAEKMYGKKPEEWNATFHKSFKKVLETPLELLVAEQLIHYFSTYGMEALGMYAQDLVYVPHEFLEIPDVEITEDIPVIVLHSISAMELSDRLQRLLTSGIALSKQTVADIMTLSDYIYKDKFDEIKNREVKIALYDKYNIVPNNNMEFLRYLTYKLTNSTLFIQNRDMIKSLRKADEKDVKLYLDAYLSKPNGVEKLAEIFLRNKNIFCALKRKGENISKVGKEINHNINVIRKKAKKHHKPVKGNILDNLNSLTTVSSVIDNSDSILAELDKITVFREIRIRNGLRYRLNALNSGTDASIVYRIRSGKSFATKLNTDVGSRIIKAKQMVIDIVEKHLVARLTPILKDKTFYIPDNVTYMAPASEKQFLGNIPEGSIVEVHRDDNMVIGVHWFNLPRERVDLDLKMMNKNEHYGWNVAYLSDNGDIVFSGDVTDAPKPNGATEVFLISPKLVNKSFLIKLNNFTQNKATVPFEFIVARGGKDVTSRNYTVNPNDVVMTVNNKFDNDNNVDYVAASLTLGYVEVTHDTIKIFFNNFEDVSKAVSSVDDINKNIFDYTNLYHQVQLSLNDLIEQCGGKIYPANTYGELEPVGKDEQDRTLYRETIHKVDYDLSLEAMTKDTIINILVGE